MCNQNTTGFNFARSGCGCNSCGWNTYGCGNGVWGWGGQSICRDCNGNIWVNQCRRNSCGCCNTCGCNGNNGTTTQNGNGQTGRFTCVTFCGTGTDNGSTATTNAGDLYYARQYGLYPFGYKRGCGCTLDTVSET